MVISSASEQQGRALIYMHEAFRSQGVAATDAQQPGRPGVCHVIGKKRRELPLHAESVRYELHDEAVVGPVNLDRSKDPEHSPENETFKRATGANHKHTGGTCTVPAADSEGTPGRHSRPPVPP